MDRFIKIATIPLLIGIAVLGYMTMRPQPVGVTPEPAASAEPAEQDAPPEVAQSQTIKIDLSAEADQPDEPLVRNTSQHDNAQGRYIPLGQIERRGTGPVNMILIAGNGETWEIWDAFMDRNADSYTMWAVTLPGFGGGEMAEIGLENGGYLRRAWIKNAGRAVLGLINDEGITDPVLMGHQIGGQLAVYISLAVPETASSVISLDGEPVFILGDPTWRPTDQDRHAMVTTQIAPQLATMKPKDWASRQRYTPETYIRDKVRGKIIGEMIAQAPMEAMHQYIKEFALNDLTGPLATSTVPTLFVGPFYHYEDETFRIDREVRWFDMLADAPGIVQIVFFYNSSSWITEDQPEYLDEAVRAFLAGEEVVGSPPLDPFAEESQAPDDQ